MVNTGRNKVRLDSTGSTNVHPDSYWPLSAAEAVRICRHGYGDILDPRVKEAVAAVTLHQNQLWQAKRELSRLLSTGE